MNFTLVEIEELTGKKLKVYSILTEENAENCYTLYDEFIDANRDQFKSEIVYINDRIEVIAKYTGLRDDFLKKDEGSLKDANYFLRQISAVLADAVREGSLTITNEGLESNTEFNYTIDNDE